jgi:hypothetical protein
VDFFISSPSSWQQSFPILCLSFFYLILQGASLLIYRADIARKLEHHARILDSASIHRTAATFRDTFAISQDSSGQSCKRVIDIIKQAFYISHSFEQQQKNLFSFHF